MNFALLANAPSAKTFSSVWVKFCFFLVLLYGSLVNAAEPTTDAESQRQLLQLVEYIGVDYSAAVEQGEIIDIGEYQEMQNFAAIISEKSSQLLKEDKSLILLSQKLEAAVEEKKETSEIQAITSQLKTIMLRNSPTLLLPKELMPEREVSQLYQDNCASCHGIQGLGDGKMAVGLVPAPTDFTEFDRAMNRSVMGLFDVISGGLEGTAMTSYNHLNSRQRWSLAFYVGSMAFQSKEVSIVANESQLTEIINFSPNELLKNNSNIAGSYIESLRANPNQLFANQEDPLVIADQKLTAALLAYKQNDLTEAKQLAVSAYLDGFELIENSIDARDKPFRKIIEGKLLGLRIALSKTDNLVEVEQSIVEIKQLLSEANSLLSGSSMSDGTLFSASFIILLREGLEALLVVLALFTILVRSGKQEAIKYLHFGWITALVAGFATWLIAQHLIKISGASREIMEGVAAMLAAVILFYVGFWMHNKSQADQWQKYITQNINQRLNSGTLWGISGLAFIAVYREVFETVLFYQSLLTQTDASQNFVFVSGFAAAVVVLLIVSWVMIKYSVKLPIGKFFSITTYLLLILSFILMGKAIMALQEAAIIGIAPMMVNFQVDWLGINSTWQGVGAQLLVLILSLALIIKQWLSNKAEKSVIS